MPQVWHEEGVKIMKNNKFLLYAVIVIAFVTFNIVVFQLPINKTEVFWWSYGFSCISYIVLLIIFHNVFCIEEEIKSRFLGFPIVYIGILYFFIQLVFFSVTLFYQNIPKWIVIIVNTLLLGLTMILISFTQIGKNYVKSIDEKNQDEVLFTKGVVMKLEVLKKKFHQEENHKINKNIK